MSVGTHLNLVFRFYACRPVSDFQFKRRDSLLSRASFILLCDLVSGIFHLQDWLQGLPLRPASQIHPCRAKRQRRACLRQVDNRLKGSLCNTSLANIVPLTVKASPPENPCLLVARSHQRHCRPRCTARKADGVAPSERWHSCPRRPSSTCRIQIYCLERSAQHHIAVFPKPRRFINGKTWAYATVGLKGRGSQTAKS